MCRAGYRVVVATNQPGIRRRYFTFEDLTRLTGTDAKHPAPGDLLECRGEHSGTETDVSPKIEPIRDMVRITQDLRLRGIAFGPVPLLFQRAVELIGVLHALDVASRTGIAVPVPGAADPVRLLVDSGGETQSAQPVQHVEPCEAGPDDNHVESVVVSCA